MKVTAYLPTQQTGKKITVDLFKKKTGKKITVDPPAKKTGMKLAVHLPAQKTGKNTQKTVLTVTPLMTWTEARRGTDTGTQFPASSCVVPCHRDGVQCLR